MTEDVLVILQEAINKEDERSAYYEDAAQRACNPLAQETFAFLAAQERRHAAYIKEYYAKMEAGGGWPDPSACEENCQVAAAEIRGIFSSARASIEGDVTCDTDLRDAYNIAMQAERESIDFYRHRLQSADDPNAKAFYEALLQAERLHLQLLSSTDDFLNDTEKWFLDEEQWGVTG